MKRLVLLVFAVAVVAVLAWSAETPSSAAPLATMTVAEHAALDEPAFEGAKSGCRRCHLKQYRQWEKTPHAGSLETLPEEERSNPECLKCHTTGYGHPSGFTSAEETPELAYVGCEACHGAGSLYKDRDVMKDLEQSKSLGLVLPTAETCQQCHNEESPTFKGFDFEEYKAKGVHEISS